MRTGNGLPALNARRRIRGEWEGFCFNPGRAFGPPRLLGFDPGRAFGAPRLLGFNPGRASGAPRLLKNGGGAVSGRFGLTPRMAEALGFIARRIEADGTPPSLQEIASELGIGSRMRARELLRGLRERGHIDWIDGRERSLRILPPEGIGGLDAVLSERLATFCASRGERVADVIADAVALHLDSLEGEGAL